MDSDGSDNVSGTLERVKSFKKVLFDQIRDEFDENEFLDSAVMLMSMFTNKIN